MTLVISPEVTEYVGQQHAARLRTRTTLFTCTDCETPGDVRHEDAAVVVRASPELTSVTIAHQRCSASEVRMYEAGSLRPSVTELIPRAIGIPSPRGIRPALLLAFEAEVTLLGSDGQETNPVGEALQAQGLHRLPSLGKAPAPSPGWLIRVGPRDALQVNGPDGRHLEDGQMTVPEAWRALVAPSGHVMLLMGQLDAETLWSAAPQFSALGRAVSEGRLLAGSCPSPCCSTILCVGSNWRWGPQNGAWWSVQRRRRRGTDHRWWRPRKFIVSGRLPRRVRRSCCLSRSLPFPGSRRVAPGCLLGVPWDGPK